MKRSASNARRTQPKKAAKKKTSAAKTPVPAYYALVRSITGLPKNLSSRKGFSTN